MNTGLISGLVTVLLLAVFLYGCYWAFSAQRKQDFEEAARLPLEDYAIMKGDAR